MQQTGLVLKQGKEKPLLQRHHWIFSGAIAKFPQTSEPIVPVFTSEGVKIGLAALSKGHSIAGYMLAFGEETLEEALRQRIRSAIAFRRKWQTSNAYRLIHAEGDGIPGLIVDSYDGILVVQISHPALDALRSLLVSLLVEEVSPRGICEKSTSFLRKKEGLSEARSCLYGESPGKVVIQEDGLSYCVDLEGGQKTGWFLDQREMRALVRSLSRDRTVLNTFAYTGGFSVAALAGGAKQVDSVEISKRCEPILTENLRLNGFDGSNHRFLCEDAFKVLRQNELPYDLIVLDPPAFVKKREDIAQAFRAYKEINGLAMKKMPTGSILVTSSCSYHVDAKLFQQIIFRAALEAGKKARILSFHRQAFDHPVSIYHPESTYLKSLILYIE